MKVTVNREKTSMSVIHKGDGPIPLQDLLCDLERAVIGKTIKSNRGVKARAAKKLSLKRTTLIEKSRKYGLLKP